MALKQIRLRDSTTQREGKTELTLDGVRVRLRAVYVARSRLWYLDTLDLESNPIVRGLALVPGADLWRPYKHLAVPQGTLFVLSAQTREPGNLETQDVSALLAYREVGT